MNTMTTTDLDLTPARRERLTELSKLKAWQILLAIFFTFAVFLPSLAASPNLLTAQPSNCLVGALQRADLPLVGYEDYRAGAAGRASSRSLGKRNLLALNTLGRLEVVPHTRYCPCCGHDGYCPHAACSR